MSVFPTLKIGNVELNPPILQGGMGVRVSLANLASAVANEGCGGVIATAGIGKFMENPRAHFTEVNTLALQEQIRSAKAQSNGNGAIGVNIMVALADYDKLVRASVEEGVGMIISGAGLPLSLPEYAQESDVKLIPIVSSARAFQIICTKWQKRYQRLPDAVIIEGALAGGHLGYDYDDVVNNTAILLEDILAEVLPIAQKYSPVIPVIVAGGIFDGGDISRFLKLGASGVQMATRFVCTDECDAADSFKQAYIEAGVDDVAVIKSPVGLPGKVIRNKFVEAILDDAMVPYSCKYRCLKSCDAQNAPYCIAEVLANAAEGVTEYSFVFAGSNVHRCHEIVSVETLISQITREYEAAENPVLSN